MPYRPWINRFAHLPTVLSLLCIWPLVSFSQDSLVTTFFFDTDEDHLRSQHIQRIDDLFLNIDSTSTINSALLLGYADRRGPSLYNQQLSLRRAKTIGSHLLDRFSTKLSQIRHRAFGSSLSSGENFHNDRRVDLILYITPSQSKTYDTAIEVEDLATIDTALLRTGIHLKVKNLNFQPGRSRLLKSSIPQLKKLEQLLMSRPNLSIRIEGHVCCSNQLQKDNDGRDVDNGSDNLSDARAQNIHDYLVKKGIEKDRLSYIGYGHSRPYVYPETSESDRMLNRRVEILITKS